jgi:hypothetical protein
MKNIFIRSFVFVLYTFLSSLSADAATGSFNRNYYSGSPIPVWDLKLDFTTDKDVYAPGESVIITGTVKSTICGGAAVPCPDAFSINHGGGIVAIAFGIDPAYSSLACFGGFGCRQWGSIISWGPPLIAGPITDGSYPVLFQPLGTVLAGPAYIPQSPSWDGVVPAIWRAVLTAPATGGVHNLVARSSVISCWAMCTTEMDYFNGVTIQVQSGTVNVTSNIPSASWSLSGAKSISGTGLSFSASGQPVGNYTITWNPVAGYTAPPSQTFSLSDGGTISFNGNYQLNACAVGSTLSFQPRTNYPMGFIPRDIYAGDLNMDGKDDIVVGNGDNMSATIGILMNNGDGTFAPRSTLGAGTATYALAVGDVNGDNRADIVTSNYASNNVSVFINNGSGTFAPKVNYPSGAMGYDVALSDFNSDGKLDIAVANKPGAGVATVSVLMNNGNGTFAPVVNYGSGYVSTGVFATDVNSDGKSDILSANFGENSSNDSVSVLMNNGNGTFASRVEYSSNVKSPETIVASDINNDGKPDLIAANFGGNSVTVMINNGNGTFASGIEYTVGAIWIQGVDVADFNKDGWNDVVATDRMASKISVLLNNGNGTFAPMVQFDTDQYPIRVLAHDFNNDGKMDIASSNSNLTTKTVSVFLGNCGVPPPTLKICENACGGVSSFDRNNMSFSMARNENRQLKACYDTAPTCATATTDVTATTTWIGTNLHPLIPPYSASDTVSVSPTGLVSAGSSVGDENITATHLLITETTNVNVVCVESVTCSDAERSKQCIGTSFSLVGSCGTVTCDGTRNCNYNWIEIAP